MKKTAENMGGFEIISLLVAWGGAFALSLWYTVLIWGWFMVPLGLPALGAAHLFGLGCVKAIMFTDFTKESMFTEMKKEYKKGPWYDLFLNIFSRSFILLVAYIATLFL